MQKKTVSTFCIPFVGTESMERGTMRLTGMRALWRTR